MVGGKKRLPPCPWCANEILNIQELEIEIEDCDPADLIINDDIVNIINTVEAELPVIGKFKNKIFYLMN